jgi:hypothetical protein
MSEKSIIDLGVELWDDTLMCHHLGVTAPRLNIRSKIAFTQDVLGRIFTKDFQLVDYWRERAKLKGIDFPSGIKKISISVER